VGERETKRWGRDKQGKYGTLHAHLGSAEALAFFALLLLPLQMPQQRLVGRFLRVQQVAPDQTHHDQGSEPRGGSLRGDGFGVRGGLGGTVMVAVAAAAVVVRVVVVLLVVGVLLREEQRPPPPSVLPSLLLHVTLLVTRVVPVVQRVHGAARHVVVVVHGSHLRCQGRRRVPDQMRLRLHVHLRWWLLRGERYVRGVLSVPHRPRC